MVRHLVAALLALASLCWGEAARPHALPGTAVLLDFRSDGIAAELEIPLDQLELGFKRPLMDAPLAAAQLYWNELPAYLLEHVRPVAPDGRPWTVRVTGLRVAPAAGGAPIELRARLWMAPPPHAPVRRLRLDYGVVNHEVMTHTVMVFARSDWNNGVFGGQPQLLGTVRFLVTGIDIDRDQGSFRRGLRGVVGLGLRHIAEGADHLLFLLALLLPAPLLRDGRRWGGYGGARYALVRLAKLVTAFTAGHCLTLVVGAFGIVAVPARPVELAIALSILVSALHAWRPLLGAREAWVAAGFGLVHGLAFSQVLAGGGLDGWHKAAAVFGFNVGIELVQLLAVALAAPWLILLARAGRYAPVRLAGAALAAVASAAWMLERATGEPNLVSGALGEAFALAAFVLPVLALWAVTASALRAPAS